MRYYTYMESSTFHGQPSLLTQALNRSFFPTVFHMLFLIILLRLFQFNWSKFTILQSLRKMSSLAVAPFILWNTATTLVTLNMASIAQTKTRKCFVTEILLLLSSNNKKSQRCWLSHWTWKTCPYTFLQFIY